MILKKLMLSNMFVISLVMVAILAGIFFRVPIVALPEHKIYDLLMRTLQAERPSSVVIVGLDEKGLEQHGPWPWPRDLLADTVQYVSEAGAKAIGLGVVLEGRESARVLSEIKALEEGFKGTTGQDPRSKSDAWERHFDDAILRLDHDAKLISAIKKARNTVLPFEFVPAQDLEQTDKQDKLSGLLRINSVTFYEKPESHQSLLSKVKAAFNQSCLRSPDWGDVRETFPELAGKAGALGHINLAKDYDEVVRSIPLFSHYRGRWFPTLSLQLSAKFLELNIKDLLLSAVGSHVTGLRFGDHTIPIDGDQCMFIRYRDAIKGIKKVSIADVLSKGVDPGLFRDKIVLIGNTSCNRTILFHTPTQRGMTNIEILAHATDTIVNNDFLSRPVWARMLEMGVVVYFGLFLLFIIPKVNLRLGIYILCIFLITWVLAVAVVFHSLGVWLWALPPVVLSICGYLFLGIKTAMARFEDQGFVLNRTLGLTYQSQGLLDMAFEKFKACPPKKNEVKQLLYDLGQEFERKRMFSKALAVYDYILRNGVYKDLVTRIKNLRRAGALVLNGKPEGPTKTLRLDDGTAAPTFGRYEIIRELGQGAMGTVYLGKDPKIKREVAVKTLEYHTVLPDELNEVKSRFFHEAETAGRLSHPHIVTIYDVGEERDMAYIAMELLDGEDLTYYCRKENLLPVGKVLSIMSQVAAALSYAHQNGVIHRDIKPSNIMLLENSQVKVTDFGIARAVDQSKTRTGIILGTPAYMSPEQVAGKKPGGQSDLFSLGIVLYELLTGERPFSGEDLTSLMYAITKGTYTPLTDLVSDLAPCCVDIVNKLMIKGLTRRYKSAETVARDIQNCAEILGFTGD